MVVSKVSSMALSMIQTYLVGVQATISQLLQGHRCLTDQPRQDGKVAIVTGGAKGIGLEVTKGLAQLGMHVFIGGRSQDEANIAIEHIKKSCPQAKVEFIRLDLASMKSIHQFVEKFKSRQLPLHLLINNAGVMLTPYSLTEDGFETHFGINHLGHFLLTNLLLDTLRSSGKSDHWSRIVFVSSAVHSIGDINFDDLNSSKNYSPHAGYAQSKLANVLTAYELQERLLADQSHVTANALHPGVVNSDLYQHVMWPMRVAQRIMGWIGLTKTPAQGADTILYAAMSPDLEGIGGHYLDNCQSVPSCDQSYNKDLQKRLWEESCRLVHLQE
ncbi:dehydrogenase/reductase SDR family member on chromosome X-like [Branchiostoma floridae]|uniref:Dehydrogenase/reductase SDR family member on chromosome X-like n=1 Tax=Branchiostoma floridae TaxID=7739 RepID=A0A9J7MXT0_BRAFL|nr:dehydrogenase/reductase SDR family member on chromosome X-like [Branchiostoma floridae]